MLEGKVAVVTGASRGIGREIALTLAGYGATVIVNYCGSKDRADAVVDEITAAGGSAKAYQGDVSDFNVAKEMMTSVKKEFGSIDILVNNAGITRDGLFMRMSDVQWLDVINTNLNSAYYVTNPVSKIMIKQRSGAIVNMASISGIYGNAGQANYSTAKAGLIGFTKALAKELASRNIRVNAVAPGFIQTDMTKDLPMDKIIERIPLKKLGQPEDIAAAVKFLALDTNYITGQVLSVDGGLVI